MDHTRLAALVQVLNKPEYRLGLDDVEPDILGRALQLVGRKWAIAIEEYADYGPLHQFNSVSDQFHNEVGGSSATFSKSKIFS